MRRLNCNRTRRVDTQSHGPGKPAIARETGKASGMDKGSDMADVME